MSLSRIVLSHTIHTRTDIVYKYIYGKYAFFWVDLNVKIKDMAFRLSKQLFQKYTDNSPKCIKQVETFSVVIVETLLMLLVFVKYPVVFALTLAAILSGVTGLLAAAHGLLVVGSRTNTSNSAEDGVHI